MVYNLTMTIEPPVDSRALYDQIKIYQLNVTDVINVVLVYGIVEGEDLCNILLILENYNYTKISLNRIKP